ncbi:Subtilisin-like protease SBT5.4-like protein [Drosera capensis]
MAAIEAAINDDVDVLSLSIGFASFRYFADPLAVGSFHAVKNGISVVAVTGNEGPGPLTASNLAPWLLTVGASSIDMELVNYLTLGNKMIIKDSSLTNKALPTKKLYPLAFGVDAAANNDTNLREMFCVPGSLDPAKVKGKILVCIQGQAYLRDSEAQASDGGAVGLILMNNKDTGEDVMPVEFPLPFTLLPFSKGQALFSNINSTLSPVAYLTRGMDMVGRAPAPMIAMFSSRRPNIVTPEILKPDITAPGIDILAATSQATKGPYETMQGTSMACPHVASVAALLKKIHPHWSPSAIKSAIMATASTLDSRNKPMLDYTLEKATLFDFGSGHMTPNLAMDPGLVYDMDHHDYLKFLCAIGYKKDMIKSGNARVTRRLKNVGTPGTYVALLNAPAGVTVTVEPSKLTFEKKGQELKFSVIFTVDGGHRQLPRAFLFGDLV